MGKMSTTELYQAALNAEESLEPLMMFFGRIRSELPSSINSDLINVKYLRDNQTKLMEVKTSFDLLKKELHKCS